MKHPELKTKLWSGHLWNPSYYVGTAGQVSSETIRRYIEAQKTEEGEKESLYRFLSALEGLSRKAELTYLAFAQGEDRLHNADLIVKIHMFSGP